MTSPFRGPSYSLFRMLRRHPGFVAAVVVTLVVALGPSTVIFSVINTVLLQPFPYEEPDRLVMLYPSSPERPTLSVSFPDYLDWEEQNNVFSSTAAYRDGVINLDGGGNIEQLRSRMITADFFSTLGVEPQQGRFLLPEEDREGARSTVILTHGFWQRRFGSQTEILGEPLILDGRPFTVIGILPDDFQFAQSVDVYLSLQLRMPPEQLMRRGERPNIYSFARLKKEISIEQAQAEMESIAGRLQAQYPETNGDKTVVLVPLSQDMLGNIRPGLLLLLGAAGFVMVVACANLVTLFAVRAAEKSRELALRSALGALRGQLAQQQVIETLQLFVFGGLSTILFAYWALDGLAGFIPNDIPRIDNLQIDARVLGFALLFSLLIGTLAALFPAFQSSRAGGWAGALKAGSRGSGSRAQERVASVLATAQIALAILLLIGAGLIATSFLKLSSVDPGFEADNVLALQLTLPEAKYPEAEDLLTYYGQLLEQTSALPQMKNAAITSDLAMKRANRNSFWLDDRPLPEESESAFGLFYTVSGEYFETMGIPLIQGRSFSDFDRRDSVRVTLVDEVFVKRYWPQGGDPLGTRLCVDDGSDAGLCWEIVGVVGHVSQERLDETALPQFYFPYQQLPDMFVPFIMRDMTLLAATRSEPRAAISALQKEVLAIDPSQPVQNVTTMKDVISGTISRPRLAMLLLGICAAIALVFSVLSIYAVMANAVIQRNREIGIRMAIGAQRGDVLGMFLKRGLKLTFLGVFLGVVGALMLAKTLAHMLFGVGTMDPSIYAGSVLFLAGLATLATFITARRATQVDPLTALRQD